MLGRLDFDTRALTSVGCESFLNEPADWLNHGQVIAGSGGCTSVWVRAVRESKIRPHII